MILNDRLYGCGCGGTKTPPVEKPVSKPVKKP